MKAQPHTWMPYLYQIRGDNDNNKMWVRDHQRIHQLSNGAFVTANNDGWHDAVYNKFEDAVKFFDDAANDEEPL